MDLFLNNNSYITIHLDPEDSGDDVRRTGAPEAGSIHVDMPASPEVEPVAADVVGEVVVEDAIEVEPRAGAVEVAEAAETGMAEPAAVEAAEQAEPEAAIEPEPEPEPDTVIDPELEPDPEAELVPEPEPEPEPDPVLVSEPTPEPDAIVNEFEMDIAGFSVDQAPVEVVSFEEASEGEPSTEDEAEAVVPIVNPRQAPRVNPVNLDSEVDRYEMYQDAVSSSNTLGIGLVILMLVIALMVAVWVGFGYVADQAKDQGAQTLRDSIMDTAMQCFAIEGYYPPTLEYLQENYGLSINEDDYVVVYVAFASNVPPTVDVRLR